jgi:hypothetical protein
LRRITPANRSTVAASSITSALPSTTAAPSCGLPNRPHPTRVTRWLLRIRLTLKLSAGVQKNS